MLCFNVVLSWCLNVALALLLVLPVVHCSSAAAVSHCSAFGELSDFCHCAVIPWTLSVSESDLSAPPPLVSSATFEPTLRKLNIPDDPRWAKKLHYKMRRKDVVQSRVLRVESALSGKLPEHDIFQATN